MMLCALHMWGGFSFWGYWDGMALEMGWMDTTRVGLFAR